jgi:hypothetical protein
MSSVVKAILTGSLMDVACVEETLKAMGIEYRRVSGLFIIQHSLELKNSPYNSVELFETTNGVSIRYQSAYSSETNRFIEKFIKSYKAGLEEKIRKVKLDEARLQEEAAIKKFSEEELLREKLKIKREKERLEELKRREEEELKRQLDEKLKIIKEKAQKQGYAIREEIQGKEKVLVLVRRA